MEMTGNGFFLFFGKAIIGRVEISRNSIQDFRWLLSIALDAMRARGLWLGLS
jgi:hypothetical protein